MENMNIKERARLLSVVGTNSCSQEGGGGGGSEWVGEERDLKDHRPLISSSQIANRELPASQTGSQSVKHCLH